MKKLNVAIALGAIVAVLGAAMVFLYGHQTDARIAAGRRTVPVLVADSALPQGATLSQVAAATHVAQVPAAYVVRDPLASIAELTSPTVQDASATSTSALADSLVLLGPVAPGGQLSRDLFGTAQSAQTLRPSAGHVAVAVDSDITPGVARYVTAGSRVDIFVTYTAGVGMGNGAASVVTDRTKLFLSNVRVLSVQIAQEPSKSGSGTATNSTLSDKVVTVLDLSPTDAEKVINATQLGSIYFALDTSGVHSTPRGATPGDVVGNNR